MTEKLKVKRVLSIVSEYNIIKFIYTKMHDNNLGGKKTMEKNDKMDLIIQFMSKGVDDYYSRSKQIKYRPRIQRNKLRDNYIYKNSFYEIPSECFKVFVTPNSVFKNGRRWRENETV